MQEGKDVQKRLRKEERGGIPWLVILDAEGNELVNSNGPKGNIGCPVQPEEVEHFLVMVDKTRQKMSDVERATLEKELQAFATGVLEGMKRR